VKISEIQTYDQQAREFDPSRVIWRCSTPSPSSPIPTATVDHPAGSPIEGRLDSNQRSTDYEIPLSTVMEKQ
jgi:hypothetical protein